MKNASTAQNLDWELSPYNFPPMETDACECGSCLCTDCGSVAVSLPDGWTIEPHQRFWLTYYKLKRRVLRLVKR